MILLVVSSTLLPLYAEAQAEPRLVIGVKNGAGAGDLGLEIELEWGGGWATGFNIGTSVRDEGKIMAFALLVRPYFSPRPVNRWFSELLLGVIPVEFEGIPVSASFYGLGLGSEWRISPNLRLSIEIGLGVANATLFGIPVSSLTRIAGASLGIIF